MHRLFAGSRMRFAQNALAEAYARYPRADVDAQIRAQAGPVVDEINRMTAVFAGKTENYEYVSALGLSNFYFGFDIETEISFEMRRNFVCPNPVTYEDVVSNIDSATYIDCAISEGRRTLNFQIKRYPQVRLLHTNGAFLAWLDTEVFAHYAPMNGTILVVLLQPNTPPAQTALRFSELSAALLVKQSPISFDEVAVSYTDYNNGHQTAALHKLYPREERIDFPLEQVLMRFRGEI